MSLHQLDESTGPARVTRNWYDWRDRLVASESGAQAGESDGTRRPITSITYDNLGEAVEVQQFDEDNVTLSWGSASGFKSPWLA